MCMKKYFSYSKEKKYTFTCYINHKLPEPTNKNTLNYLILLSNNTFHWPQTSIATKKNEITLTVDSNWSLGVSTIESLINWKQMVPC